MRHALIVEEFLRTPWALLPETISSMSMILARWETGGQPPAEVREQIAADTRAREARRADTVRAGTGNVAVLPFYGVVTQRGHAVEVSGGGTMSADRFGNDLRALVADPAIAGIVIDINSPGGGVYGVAELADTVLEARAVKPIYGVANSVAASAAYWVASCCTKLFATPGAEVGSIGVYTAHSDYSKQLEMQGVKTTLIAAGKFKTEGAKSEPLSEEARAHLQAKVDAYYQTFLRDVARGRGVPVAQVRDGMGQGRTLTARDALAARMVDGVATLSQVLGRMIDDLQHPLGARRSQAVALPHREPLLIGSSALPTRKSTALLRREVSILEAATNLGADAPPPRAP